MTGAEAEKRALQFLQAHGLQLLSRNFHCRLGEIDIIMRDSESIVFVEVRHRRDGARVSASSSVSASKVRKLVQAARFWLMQNPMEAQAFLRFDLIALDGDNCKWHRDVISIDNLA